VATFTLLSAKGSPGVSTLTVGLALAWRAALPGRSALAVDADPAGGDFAAGVLGGALPAGSRVIPLATTRGAKPVDAVAGAAVHLAPDGSAQLLAGVPDSTRAGALVLAWDILTAARPDLADQGRDLLVDAGRVDLSRSAAPWLVSTDLALLVLRPTLPAVAAAHRFVARWSAPGAETAATPLEILIVSAPSPYREREVAAAVGAPCRAVIPFDPAHARVHSEGVAPMRGFARSGYARALVGLVGGLGAEHGLPADGASQRGDYRPGAPAHGGGGAR
jgi:MinD-like ATPase involved in chromosome partitioning or flagellar assembly